MTSISRTLALFIAAPFLVSCQSVSVPQTLTSPPASSQPVIPFTPTGMPEFDAWRVDFAQRAVTRGFSDSTVRLVLTDIRPVSHFFDRPTDIVSQAEFSKPIWDYVKDTVSRSRLTTGREKLQSDAALFSALDATYGVPGNYVAAIWGMETSYGAVIGDFDGPSVLASMAVEGRRKSFAEDELYAIMQLLDRGDAKREWLKAGWAGAMGHTQFMPSTYYAYAVDWTGDGTKDVWRARADALASAANYLKASGWRAHEPAVREVVLPQNFDFGLADGSYRSISSWSDLGIVPATEQALAPVSVSSAELWLPAGANGPAFLLFPNFNVIKTYNRSDSYALAVSLLAEGFRGQTIPSRAWPLTLDRLNIEEIRRLQEALNQLGYDAGSVDGIAGRGTRSALQKFQKDRNLMADGYPTRRALALVQAAGG